MKSITMPVQHSILLIMGNRSAQIPDTMNDSPSAATESCIAISTRPAVDGETAIALYEQADNFKPSPSMLRMCSHTIDTPANVIHVCSTSLESLLSVPTANARTSVTVWVDDITEPSAISITIDIPGQ